MSVRVVRWLLVGLMVFSASCAAPSARRGGAAGPAPAGLEGEVSAAVNAHRRASRLSTLRYSEMIAAVARGHSQRMASGAVGFGHDGMQKRAREIAARLNMTGLAENVSRHERKSGFVDAALRGWLKSAVHRANMEGDYDLTGVGAATGSDGVVYVTQLFVRTGP